MTIGINKYFKKIKPLVLKNETIKNKTFGFLGNISQYKEHIISCPICKTSFGRDACISDDRFNQREERAINDLCKSLLNHIEYNVRYKGDIQHIEFMILLLGESESLSIAQKWAKTNINIGNKIKQYIEIKMKS